MFITILVLFIFILLIYNYYYVHYGRNARLLNLIPGPSGFPIIGNAFQSIVSEEKLWKLFCTLPNEYYPIFKFGGFFVYGVLISHPDDLETILSSTKHIEKGHVYNLLHPWLNTGLLTSTGVKWQTRRKILTPTFHFNILNQFVDILIKEGDYMTKSLKDVGSPVVKDLSTFISEHTLNAICVKKKRLAMLDLLIAASQDNSLTDLDIREEVDTFMFEGHDTTASAIMFILLLLAEYKDIQERVRIEVDNVMQENEGKLDMKCLQKLSYLERCLKEALRLYPSVCFIFRKPGEDVKLQSYIVPAGSLLCLNIYGVHRDPNFWPNPEVFDPDRFLPERIQTRHPYCYIPFSAGPRNCIGQRFGLLELKSLIAPLVHNFYLEPITYLKDIQFKIDLVIRPSHPVHIKFIPIR